MQGVGDGWVIDTENKCYKNSELGKSNWEKWTESLMGIART